MAMADFMQKPEENAEILKDFKVEMPQQTQSEMQNQTQPEAPEQKPRADAPQGMRLQLIIPAVSTIIDESKIDWANLKEKWGIDRDELAKSGDLKGDALQP